MINNTTLVGRLTKNPELKYTGSGIAVTNFTLAVERNFTNAQGERETDFINCVAWRGTAETLSNFAVQGSLIGVTGSIQTRNYENNEGRTIYVTEVLTDNFQMLEPKSVTDNRRNQAGGNQSSNNYDKSQANYSKSNQSQKSNKNKSNENPFADINFDNENPFESNDDVTDISDDDLPF
ncbi:MAG: single-stranded DNA-binding protein [Atopostipes sp.]|nr:single-stranded DNA-binding protein [Atopostipes sp.]